MSQRMMVAVIAFLFFGCAAQAASISISPIRLDVPAPASSASVTLLNEAALPANIQIRMFKWKLNKGEVFYEESDDVVATPPVATVPPGGSALVRIVRTGAAPVVGEEAYRLVVDEIPDANRVRNVGVNIALRYIIPVFFLKGDATQPKVDWSIRTEGGKRMLVATNTGDKNRRIVNLRLDKTTIVNGLAGYVLGHSTRMWPLPAKASGARILADTDAGPIDAALAR